jgi:putative efflux protein, MATE family
MITDMTKGSPAKIILKFSIPMLLSVIFQQMYSVADSIVAGKFVGLSTLAAVGASYPITMIFMAIATGLNIGSSVVISQLFGSGKYGKLKNAVYTALISVSVISIIMTIIGLIICEPMLKLLQTPSDIMAESKVYLTIYIFGLFFLFLYNICNGVFTALGDSKTPLYFLIGSSLGNILLAVTFVTVFHFGVAGIAWATFLAQGSCSLLAFWRLTVRMKKIKPIEEYDVFSWEMVRRINRIAIPSVLQQSFVSVGNLFIQGLVNSFGVDATAGYSAAVKLNVFAITIFVTISNSISSFTAQNIGAGKTDRVKKGFWVGVVEIFCMVAPFVFAFLVFKTQMLGLFLDKNDPTNQGAIKIGSQFLWIVSPFYFIVSLKLMTDGVLRGAGAVLAFMISTFSDLILRVVLSYVLAVPFGIMGVWLSWPIGWIVGAALSAWFYARGNWKHMADQL